MNVGYVVLSSESKPFVFIHPQAMSESKPLYTRLNFLIFFFIRSDVCYGEKNALYIQLWCIKRRYVT